LSEVSHSIAFSAGSRPGVWGRGQSNKGAPKRSSVSKGCLRQS